MCVCMWGGDRDEEWGQGKALVIQSVCQEIIKTILKDAKRNRERGMLWSRSKLLFFLLITGLWFSTDAKRCYFAPYYDNNFFVLRCVTQAY